MEVRYIEVPLYQHELIRPDSEPDLSEKEGALLHFLLPNLLPRFLLLFCICDDPFLHN